MKNLCGMCGERQSDEELCRTDNQNERWLVCPECAQIMLNDPNLAPMWQKTDQTRAAAAGSSFVMGVSLAPVSLSRPSKSPC
jgi:hypothetical protein